MGRANDALDLRLWKLKGYPEHQVLRLVHGVDRDDGVPMLHWVGCRSFRATKAERVVDGSTPDSLRADPALIGANLPGMLWEAERAHRVAGNMARLYFCELCMSERK